MKITDLLKGKKVKVMTDAKVEVELTIESVKEKHHSQDVGPSNAENDWWPEQATWKTIDVTFTNEYKKSYDRLSDIEIVE